MVFKTLSANPSPGNREDRAAPLTRCPTARTIAGMAKEKHLLLAVAAASLAVALTACDQTTPTAGPGAAAAPAAAQPGIVSDTIVIALKADTDQAASMSRRRANVVQRGPRIDRTLSFPSDFTHTEVQSTHRWTHGFDRPDITQDVLDRGGIVPWISLDGGETWLTAFSLPSWSITIGARVGKLSVTITVLTYGQTSGRFIPFIQNELTNNAVMIRLLVLRATG